MFMAQVWSFFLFFSLNEMYDVDWVVSCLAFEYEVLNAKGS